jgi:superoxide reductase
MKLRDLYYCEICGNVTEVLHVGAEALVCCGEPMEKMEAKSEDTGLEKHVPVVEENENGITVKVGSVEHPMVEKHWIAFIEVLTEKQVLRAELNPGEAPEAHFNVKLEDVIEVREWCNLHGLWKAKL